MPSSDTMSLSCRGSEADSSDLMVTEQVPAPAVVQVLPPTKPAVAPLLLVRLKVTSTPLVTTKIGRASCRERVETAVGCGLLNTLDLTRRLTRSCGTP